MILYLFCRSQTRRGKKRQKDHEADLSKHEDVPRKRFHGDMEKEQRHLLPIKSGKKIIPQSVDKEGRQRKFS